MADPTQTPLRRAATYLNEKTWVSLGYVLTLVALAVSLTNMAGGINAKFERQEFQNDKTLQRLADLAERVQSTLVTREDFKAHSAAWAAWVSLLRAQLPPEMRAAVPEPPK